MKRSDLHILALTAAGALFLQGCEQRAPTDPAIGVEPATSSVADATGRYIVLFAAERVPPDFGERVSTLGGSVEASLDQIGVAAVTGLTEGAAAELATQPGIQHVERDIIVTLDDFGEIAEEPASEAPAPADATSSPTSAALYPQQWNLRAIFADVAWEAGHLGSRNAVVAILDTGIDYLHPDLEGLVDLERSKSFVPEDDPVIAERFPGRLPISDLRFHGTSVASIVASNGIFVAGVNQEVTLVAVKVWNQFGRGPLTRLLAGIVYAADQGVDVINVSGNYTRDKSENPGIVAASNRAANYAFRKGVLIVSGSGNDAMDLDHNGDIVRLPCEAPHAICAAGTAPTAAAGPTGPWEDVDARAPFSSFGRSAIDVAAPAGRSVRPPPPTESRTVWALCTTTPTEGTLPPPCRAGQAAFKTFGNSYATAHISGLAALLVAQLGHDQPVLIRSRILRSADDLGDPGTDPFYGKGRINVARALGVID